MIHIIFLPIKFKGLGGNNRLKSWTTWKSNSNAKEDAIYTLQLVFFFNSFPFDMNFFILNRLKNVYMGLTTNKTSFRRLYAYDKIFHGEEEQQMTKGK